MLRSPVFAILLFSAPVWAADPFIGFWKLDPSQSALRGGPQPSSGGIYLEASRDGYDFYEAVVFDNNKVSRRSGLVRFGLTQWSSQVSILTSRIDAESFEEVIFNSQNGKELTIRQYTVYPQIGMLIVVERRRDETPLSTRVFKANSRQTGRLPSERP